MSICTLSPDATTVWTTNLAALSRRWPAIALALSNKSEVSQSSVISLESAAPLMAKMTPGGCCTEPLLIAGADLAVWAAVFQLPCKALDMPTHRPPLYFLARTAADLNALSALDCSAMFTDPRVQLFLGADAVAQCKAFQLANPQIPAAKTCVTLDPELFAAGESAEQFWPQHLARCTETLLELERAVARLTSRWTSGTRPRSMRVLGITSRYTTFLQHSMRDWMESLRHLGHETELIIESFDHELANPISLARATLQFRPDLIVMIDHYRAELRGLPKNVPFVMWIQDELSHIFCPSAGVAQGELDFCLGFGRLHLRDRCGYPERQFLTTPVGVNTRRFASAGVAPQTSCDVSFVSNASAPATSLLETQLQRADANARKVLIDVFEWLKSQYEGNGCITHLSLITRFIDQALERYGIRLEAKLRQGIDDFFITRIHNALFRHQTLNWAAGSGLKLDLWGRGWEQHGRLRRFAKGVACNQSQLRDIYQRSAINLQIVPTGAIHQRLLDGLSADGFFLLRETAGDRVEPIYRELLLLAEALELEDTAAIRGCTDPRVQHALRQIHRTLGVSAFELKADLMDVLQLSADCRYIRSAASVLEDYSTVAFNSREQFVAKSQHFLSRPAERSQIVSRMKQVVQSRFSYDSINQNLLKMIDDQLPATSSLSLAA